LSDVPKKQQHCCFEVVTSARTYKMLAKNSEDKDSWIRELDLARRMFGDEADLEDALANARKKLEEEYKAKQSKVTVTQREKDEKDKTDKAKKEKRKCR